MADEYTPTTDVVRAIYGRTPIGGLWKSTEEAFDRWLAAHDEHIRQEEAARLYREILTERDANDAVGDYPAGWRSGMTYASQVVAYDQRKYVEAVRVYLEEENRD